MSINGCTGMLGALSEWASIIALETKGTSSTGRELEISPTILTYFLSLDNCFMSSTLLGFSTPLTNINPKPHYQCDNIQEN